MKIHLTKTLFMKKVLKCIGHCIPVLAILLLGACHAQEPRGNRVNKSSLIFKAEVLLLQTSTINWSDPSDLAVVRLLEIYEGEEQLSAFIKEPITVKFADIKGVKKGQNLIVFGNLWIANESIAIIEVDHEVLGENKFTNDNYQQEIKKEMQEAELREIKVKAAQSEIVIAGTVISVKKTEGEKSFESEHNPEWVLAEIKIDEPLKGNNASGSIITIAFPGSQDFMWYQSPRFKEGDKKIWFLSKENFGYQTVKQLTVTTKDQVREMRDLEKIKQSLR
jgi:hypothetical protein